MKNDIKDHLGRVYDSVQQMCDVYDITRAEYYHRQAKGWDLEKTLTTDHVVYRQEIKCNGRTFATAADFCRHYYITRGEYESRRAEGMTPEQIVASVAKKRKKTADQLAVAAAAKGANEIKDVLSTDVSEYIDKETGVHYLVTPVGGITPRLNADGSVMKD